MKRAIAMVIGAAALHGAAGAAPVEGSLTLNGKPVRVSHVASQLLVSNGQSCSKLE